MPLENLLREPGRVEFQVNRSIFVALQFKWRGIGKSTQRDKMGQASELI